MGVKMEIIIREVEEKDYTAILTLFASEILGNSKSNDDYCDYVVQFFNSVKNNEQYKTFVALSNNSVVGFISTIAMDWIKSGFMFIQCIAVESKHQNMGIGTKLLKHTEDYANAKGLDGIGLQSGVQRTNAHAFYERNSYIKSNYYYKNF
jgi:ribosomal protein S18 acetylase RimI-like enzyme